MALISRKDQRQLDRERQQIQRANRKQLEKAAPALLAVCKKALSRLTYSEESTTYADELRSAIEQAEQ